MPLTLSAQLNHLIEKDHIIKNTLIKDTGIDRSTFYQILAGKRTPSESVFTSIMHYFIDTVQQEPSRLTQTDIDNLMKAYLRENLTDKELYAWKISSSFIRKANENLTGMNDSSDSEPIDQKVSGFLHDQLEIQNGRLDFYLSTHLIRRFHIHAFLRQSIPFHLHVNQLCGVYQDHHREISERLLNVLAEAIGFMSFQPDNYNSYCFKDTVLDKKNLLYPYYLIGVNEALLISADGNRIIHINENEDMEQIHQYIDDIISRSLPLFTHVNNYMELARNLLSIYHSRPDALIYSIAERPCFWETVTPDIITKYSPDKTTEQFALNYARALKSLPDFYGLNSYEGVAAFEQDHYISEAGLNIHLDENDMNQLQKEFDRSLWHHIILLPFSNCFIHNWEIAIYYPDTLYLSVYDNPRSVLCIKDRNIINPLYTYYNTMFRVLHKDQNR